MSTPARAARSPRPLAVLLRLLRNLAVLVRDLVAAPLAARLRPEWVVVRLDRGLVDLPEQPPWLELLRPAPRALSALQELFERAARDARVRGVVLRVGRAPLGWSQLESLVRAVGALREAGKLVVVYAESAGNAGAWLGASGDRFWMAPQGRLDLIGIRVDSLHLRDALERFGVRPDVVHAGRYKAAGEILERNSMSPEAREALEDVVEELYGALVEGLASGTGSDPETARRWIDEGPYLASQAAEIGLVHECLYGDELPARLARLARGDEGEEQRDGGEARLVPDLAYLRLSQPRFEFEPLLRARPRIALIPVSGLIRSPSAMRPLLALLRRVGELDAVRAVVLRVNSPGGDPLASDLLWRAVRKLRERKPVVASLSDLAASGGYYVAVGAGEIVAERTTLTGSIGVVLASVEFEELLEHWGVHFDGVTRGRHAAIYHPQRRRSDEERALLEAQVQEIYRGFLEKAALGRERSVAEIEPVAEGRVWTGHRAHEHGLVDRIGGLAAAIGAARERAGLAPDRGRPVVLAPRLPLWARLWGSELDPAAERTGEIRTWCPIRIPLN